MKPEFLDRTLLRNPYCVALCTKPAQLAKLQKQLGVLPHLVVGFPQSGARVTYFENGQMSPGVRQTCVVCVAESVADTYEPIQIAALLCHEAVHVVEALMDDIGEKAPSSEFRAYSTQSVSQTLMYEYARQMGHAVS